MKENPESRDDLKEAWIESLLRSASKTEDHSERIAAAMSLIESTDQATESGPNAPVLGPQRNRNRFSWWRPLGVVAATLLIVFLLFPDNGSQSAMAAIQRSLDVAGERLIRKYSVRINYRPDTGNAFQIDNDLYVQGNDRFTLRHPGLLPGTSFWLGKNQTESWVLPAFGPVLKGDNTMLSRFLRSHKELDTPYLHIATMLTRMKSRGFQLEVLEDEVIETANGRSLNCQHIQAERMYRRRSNLPKTIELWASRDSGMATKLVARWDLAAGESGRESIELMFQQEEPNLSDDWFTAESHYQGRRRITNSSSNN